MSGLETDRRLERENCPSRIETSSNWKLALDLCAYYRIVMTRNNIVKWTQSLRASIQSKDLCQMNSHRLIASHTKQWTVIASHTKQWTVIASHTKQGIASKWRIISHEKWQNILKVTEETHNYETNLTSADIYYRTKVNNHKYTVISRNTCY